MGQQITTAEDFRQKYGHWGEHPSYPVADWIADVYADNTRLGYWEWIEAQEFDG